MYELQKDGDRACAGVGIYGSGVLLLHGRTHTSQ